MSLPVTQQRIKKKSVRVPRLLFLGGSALQGPRKCISHPPPPPQLSLQGMNTQAPH